MSVSEQDRMKQAIKSIKDNYIQVEKSIVEQLYMKHDLHGPTIGTMRENIWEELFEMVLPKKFVIEHSVFIIDSHGSVSKEVDLAIMDKMYTPYIFQFGKIKFIPIEAVAAVVECKSKAITKLKQKETIIEWSKHIKALRTAEGSVTRLAGGISDKAVLTQKSTRPIRILCTLDKPPKKKGDVDKNCEFDKLSKEFDFVICAVQEEKQEQKKSSYLDIQMNSSFENLWICFKELNFYTMEDKIEEKKDEQKNPYKDCEASLKKIKLKEYEVKDENGNVNSLLTFNFQINQLLMLINNPMLFPHRKYIDMFNEKEKDDE